MIETTNFGNKLRDKGYRYYSGVPCSFLKDLINYAINDCHYYMSANEGDAVAFCSGLHLAGHKAVVMMQNSGLTNAVSPLTSLNYIFKIPVLGFVSLRGEEGMPDEPQHELTGVTTTRLLDLMEVAWEFLSPDEETALQQLDKAEDFISHGKTFFFVVKKDTFSPVALNEQKVRKVRNLLTRYKSTDDELPLRLKVLETLDKLKDEKTVMLATTGKTGRELYEVNDSPNYLYMVGSMGCVSSLAFGVAEGAASKSVIAVDGDGSLLMRMGAMPVIGYYQPKNLLHILLDNNAHDSTGGQLTVSGSVDFVSIAAASGYESARYIHTLKELESAVSTWKSDKMLTFFHMRIARGSAKEPGRPGLKPWEVKDRLMKFLSE